MKESDFFEEDFLKPTFEGNKPFTSLVGKSYHNFKIIEIINEEEVRELMSFKHVFYGKGKYQRIYIADNRELMLERLVN